MVAVEDSGEPHEKHLKFREPEINWKQTTKTVLDQYDGILDAVQKESIQNAWDASKGDSGRWKVEFRFYPDEHKLEIEDSGTTGIERWDYYKSLWYSEKAGQKGKGGSRGQGKFAILAAGRYMITETIVGGNYKVVYTRHDTRFDDDEARVSEIAKRMLNHEGTLVTVYKIRADFRDEFEDYKKMIRLIQLTWWKILEDKAATIVYTVDGKSHAVPALAKPTYTSDKKFPDKEVKFKTKDDRGRITSSTGKLEDIILFYNKGSDLPPDFRGRIAITVNGQVIEWWQPAAIPSPHNARFFGSVEAEYLRVAEQPNHSKFQRDHDAWKVTRNALESIVQEFLQPMYEKETAVDRKSQAEAELAEELLNRAFAEGFGDIDPVGEVLKKERKGRKHTDVYVRYMTLDKADYAKGDNVIAKSTVANALDESKNGYTVQYAILNPAGVKICEYEHKDLNFGPKDEMEFEFKCQLVADSIKGTYVAGIFVKNINGEVVHEIGKRFEVEPSAKAAEETTDKLQDPDEVKDKPKKKVPIRVNLKLAAFRDGRLVRYIPGEVNTVYVNYKHETTEFIRKNTPKALVYHLVVSAGNELIRIKYKQGIENQEEAGEDLNPDRMKQLIDEMVNKSEALGSWLSKQLMVH